MFEEMLDFVDIRVLSVLGLADDCGHDEYDALDDLDEMFSDLDLFDEDEDEDEALLLVD